MKLWIVPWIAGAVLLASPAAAAGEAPVRTRYTVRLEELELAQHRLVVESPGVRLLYVEELLGLESVGRRFGISLPFAVAGPLAPGGLWRKLLNPLAHGPSSTAHEEATDLRLDGSFDASDRRGAVALIGPRAVPAAEATLQAGLAVVETAHTPFQGGGWLEWYAPGLGSLEALAVYSLPPPDAEEEAWFLPEVPYPGGGLLHLAAGMRVGSPKTALSWAGALSGGPLVRSGLFGELLLRLQGPVGCIALLGGACSPDYRSPEAEPAERARRGAVRLELGGKVRSPGQARSATAPPRVGSPPPDPRSLPVISWSVESELEIASHYPPVAIRVDGGATLTELRASAAAALERSVQGGASLRLRVEGEGECRRLGSGRVENCGALYVSGRAETRRTLLEAELGWRGSAESEHTASARLYGGRRRRRGQESLCLRAALTSAAASSGTSGGQFLGAALRCDVARPGWSVFLDLHTRKDLRLGPGGSAGVLPRPEELLEQVGVTLGWDVRVRRPP